MTNRMRDWLRASSLAMGLAAAPAAWAQTASPDPAAIWTLRGENASLGTSRVTDRYYVNGLSIGYASPEGDVPAPLARAAEALWGGGAVRMTLNLSQQIYTPDATGLAQPPRQDRPYAGTLLGTVGLLRDVADSRSIITLSLGVVGPSAMAEPVQNGFHDLIDQGHTNGWHFQVRDEPIGEVTAARIWRLPIGDIAGLETDALPDLAAGMGTARIYAQTGLLLRIGQGLASDYGPGRISNGPSGGDAFVPAQPFAWYVFAGADAQAVAWDITVNGNNFRQSAGLAPFPLMAEAEAGFAVFVEGTRVSYTQVVQTREVPYQRGGLHQFGILAVSARF